jgi:single-strand DNA-binding protein
MRDINRVILMGRLGTDPVLKQTKNGISVCQFSLATEVYSKVREEAETTWHRVVVWGKTAEQAGAELKRGMGVFIEGGIRVRKYQDDEGETHYIHEVHADRVTFLHRRPKIGASESEQKEHETEDQAEEGEELQN